MSVRRPDRSADARVVELTVADDPEAWHAAGFAVEGDRLTIGELSIHLTGRVHGPRGITGWTLSGVVDHGEPDVDGLPTTFDPIPPDQPPTSESGSDPSDEPVHPNGTTGLDHIVVFTPDLERTVAAFTALQLSCRRVRDTGDDESSMRQAFFRLGPTILEVVGPKTGSGETAEAEPATWYGIAVDVEDLEVSAHHLGDGLGRIKPAVQRGRRIATLRHRSFDMSVAVALMDDDARPATQRPVQPLADPPVDGGLTGGMVGA